MGRPLAGSCCVCSAAGEGGRRGGEGLLRWRESAGRGAVCSHRPARYAGGRGGGSAASGEGGMGGGC